MAVRTLYIVSALVSALRVATALAPTASAQTYDRTSALFANAAYLGEEFNASRWRGQPEQMNLPEYSTSNGAAYVTDGSDPSYLRDQHDLMSGPGYSIVHGAAYVSDGSDPSYPRIQQQVMTEPGFYLGAD